MRHFLKIYREFENYLSKVIYRNFGDKEISLIELISNTTRIFFVIVPLIICFIALFFFFTIISQVNSLKSNMMDIVEVGFYQNLKSAMNTNDFIQVRNSLQEIRSLDNIEDIILVDNYKRIIISDDLKKDGDILNSSELSKIFKNEKIENSYRYDNKLALIFKNEPRCQRCHEEDENVLGGLVVSFNDIEPMGNKLVYFLILLLFGILIVISSKIFFKIISDKYISEPINILVQLSNNISKGKSHNGEQIKSPNEFKYLFKVLSTLSEEIDLYIEEIKMKNSEREQIKVLAGIGEMAAKVAHEVRNPLNTIDGAIHYLRRTTSNQDDQAEYLDLIDENIHRINNVASELLDATRPARPVLEKINVIRLLQERILESSRKFNNSEIIINFEAIGDIPIMFVDKHQIIQVIDNLLENAVNACEEKGKGIINIHLKKITPTPMQNFLLIRIIDNGYGIPSENLGKIFQPFFTTKSSGTGLGLSIVENIIKNHRGEINIISKLNKGTFIKIKLPLRT